MRESYMKMLDEFDEQLTARGYAEGQIEDAKKLMAMFAPRTLDDHVTNMGTVSELLDDGDECAKVLRLYLLGALDYFAEPSE